MPLAPGTLLNRRYRILEIIAQGGMGAIYRAQDESLRVEVAVKENLFSTEDYSRQFRREATILASLRQAHLPRVTDHFVMPDQGQYLVMDYIPGEDLRKRMARLGRIPEPEVLEIGISITEAVAYLHHRQPPILHRDIKPGNIKITPAGQIYLVDFGLAKIAQSGQQTTIGAQSLTPGYAPPEQYGQGTDQRSDVYALAATLYAAITGSVPEDGLSRAMGSAQLTPVRVRNPAVSDELAAVIERGMAVDPGKRYPTADELNVALVSVKSGRGRVPSQAELPTQAVSAAEPVSKPRREELRNLQPVSQAAGAGRSPGSRWLSISLIGLLVIGGLAGAGVLLSQLFGGTQPALETPTLQSPTLSPVPTDEVVVMNTSAPSPTALPATPTTPPTEVSILPTSVPTEIPTPLGTPLGGGKGQVAFASDRSGSMQVWVLSLDGSDLQQVTQMQDGACQPDWSPDGTYLVFVSPCSGKQEQYKGSSLFIINPDGSGLVSLATTPGGDFEPAWSPDGQLIAFTSLRDGRPHIYVYSLADDKAKRLSPAPVYDRQPAWSPDGQQIVFISSRQGQNQVWTMTVDGTNFQEFSRTDAGAASFPAWSRDGQIIVFSRGSPQPGLIAKRIDDRTNEFSLAETVRPALDAKFSADGKWLIFEGTQAGEPELMLMTANGTNLQVLTDGSAQDIQPSWRP